MSSKLRETVNDVVKHHCLACPYNGTKGCGLSVSKNESTYLCHKIKRLRSALAEPLRNCDVGSADEQRERHYKWCRKHGLDGDGKANCLGRDMSCNRCVLLWSQMPYESEVKNGEATR